MGTHSRVSTNTKYDYLRLLISLSSLKKDPPNPLYPKTLNFDIAKNTSLKVVPQKP